ncbi:MAG: hypothetical protein ACRDF9_12890 [Candidatus Limnocylindria bacterium]
MRVLARVLLLPAVLIGMTWAPSPALASCVQTTVAERAPLAEVVVYGTVTETRQTFAPASGVIRFRPERFLKGTLPGEVEVYLGPTKGGPITSVDYEAVTRDEAHTLYLRSADNGAWQTDVCSGSHVGAPTSEETAFFGAGTAAPPIAPRDNTLLVIFAVVVGLIVLAGLVLARRYSGRSTLTTTSP